MSPFLNPLIFCIMYETNFHFCSRTAETNSTLCHNEHDWRHQLAWSSSILAHQGRKQVWNTIREATNQSPQGTSMQPQLSLIASCQNSWLKDSFGIHFLADHKLHLHPGPPCLAHAAHRQLFCVTLEQLQMLVPAKWKGKAN
jgi:hypothetical protein